jgi:hypothetical protein
MPPIGPGVSDAPADDAVGLRRWGDTNLVAGSVIGSRRAAGDPWGEAEGPGAAGRFGLAPAGVGSRLARFGHFSVLAP